MFAEQIEDGVNTKRARRKASNEEDSHRGKNIVVAVQSTPIQFGTQGSFCDREDSYTFGYYSQREHIEGLTQNCGFPKGLSRERRVRGVNKRFGIDRTLRRRHCVM
jgi:hypothetical protein